MDLLQIAGETLTMTDVGVDALGRIEHHRGRVRLTFVKITEEGDNTLAVPALTLTMSLEAFREMADALAQASLVAPESRKSPGVAGAAADCVGPLSIKRH